MHGPSGRTAVIVGSEGQDGFYLGELLRRRGDTVIGIGRSGRVDVKDRARVAALVAEAKPAEIYYLAGVFGSSESAVPDLVLDFQRCREVHLDGWLNFLDAAERHSPGARLFYAASSRIFGRPAASPQDEATPHAPLDMYGVTKSAGLQLARLYRSRGIHCSGGILYNHESPRRPPGFVSRKIVRAAVDIKLGTRRTLTLGNLASTVDWGDAQDYVEAMTRIVALPEPDDFIIASGALHTVQEFVAAAFDAVGLAWRDHVAEDPALIKTGHLGQALAGDASRLRARTGWRPATGFREMIGLMVNAELEARKAAAA